MHVRDTLLEPLERPVQDLVRPAFVLEADAPVYEAPTQIRAAGEQLAAVMHQGRFVGVITLSDVLRRVLPTELASERNTGLRVERSPLVRFERAHARGTAQDLRAIPFPRPTFTATLRQQRQSAESLTDQGSGGNGTGCSTRHFRIWDHGGHD
ncbi:CBS domain-containing protein [Kocuria rosea]|uniref:CBS domain-containing protein n=1 Tax=Kocuria rosea TaxID=1275 RepID=UPI002330A91B|nr:CBS domain-containing protein [Kocuria rosea]